MKIRLILIIAAIALLTISASAQKEMLTKEETVNYINKKLQEIDGRKTTYYGDFIVLYSSLSFRIKGDNVELRYAESFPNGTTRHTTFEFNPKDISKFGIVHGPKSESAVLKFNVQLVTKTGRFSDTATALKDVDSVYFPYFATVADYRFSMEKALLHLRDLAKAEEEPFGN